MTGGCARGFDSHGIGVVWIVRFPDERYGEQAPTGAEGIAPVRDCLKSVLIVLLTSNIDLSPDVDGRQLQPGCGVGLCEVAVSRIQPWFYPGQRLFLVLLARGAVLSLALCSSVISCLGSLRTPLGRVLPVRDAPLRKLIPDRLLSRKFLTATSLKADDRRSRCSPAAFPVRVALAFRAVYSYAIPLSTAPAGSLSRWCLQLPGRPKPARFTPDFFLRHQAGPQQRSRPAHWDGVQADNPADALDLAGDSDHGRQGVCADDEADDGQPEEPAVGHRAPAAPGRACRRAERAVRSWP